MHSNIVTSILSCSFLAAAAGCAPTPTSSAQPSAVGVIQPVASGTIQKGRVVRVDDVVGVLPSVPPVAITSGSSTSGASASSGPQIVTVMFADGSQDFYTVDAQPGEPFQVGDDVKVITDDDGIMLVSP